MEVYQVLVVLVLVVEVLDKHLVLVVLELQIQEVALVVVDLVNVVDQVVQEL